MRRHEGQILRLLADTRITCTNNTGERSFRMIKIHDKVSGTFRSWEHAEASWRSGRTSRRVVSMAGGVPDAVPPNDAQRVLESAVDRLRILSRAVLHGSGLQLDLHGDFGHRFKLSREFGVHGPLVVASPHGHSQSIGL
jgi:hypothetical protein